MAGRAIPPDDIHPVDFFTHWVPARVEADERRRALLSETQAVLEFALLGDGGGHFTLRIEAGVVQGRVGPSERADLRVQLDLETWRQLNAGTLSAPEAFLLRRVQVRGNLTLAVKLHVILGA